MYVAFLCFLIKDKKILKHNEIWESQHKTINRKLMYNKKYLKSKIWEEKKHVKGFIVFVNE